MHAIPSHPWDSINKDLDKQIIHYKPQRKQSETKNHQPQNGIYLQKTTILHAKTPGI